MNKIISGIVVVCVSMSTGALAAEGTIPDQKPALSATGEKPAAERLDKVAQKSNCITETGSRLNVKDKNGCNGQPGRSYDKTDIEMTGATSLAEVLQRLDPSIQVGR